MATPTTLPAAFTAGQVLTAAQMNNLRGAFRILQVVAATTSTTTSSSTTTQIDTTLTATITPTSTSSKVLVYVSQNGCDKINNTYILLRLLRGATVINNLGVTDGFTNNNDNNRFGSISGMYLDSPATTSATTYKTQFSSGGGGASVSVQISSAESSIVLMEISA
jgi:hypothetical protein